MTIRKLLTGLCILTGVCNFLLLIPTPFAQLTDSAAYYASQKQNVTEAELQQMGIGRDEFERGIAFSAARKSDEVLLRWGASAAFFLVHVGMIYLVIRLNSAPGRVGLAVTALLFLIGWFASIPPSALSTEAALLDGYVFRILNEWAVDSWLWFTRFAILFCIAPVAYIALLVTLLIEAPSWDNSQNRTGTE